MFVSGMFSLQFSMHADDLGWLYNKAVLQNNSTYFDGGNKIQNFESSSNIKENEMCIFQSKLNLSSWKKWSISSFTSASAPCVKIWRCLRKKLALLLLQYIKNGTMR